MQSGKLEAMFPSSRPWHVNYLKTLAEQTDDMYEYRETHCEGGKGSDSATSTAFLFVVTVTTKQREIN